MGGFAWVTLATNDSYSLGALVLAHSLRRAGTIHELAVLITPGVTQSMREKLAAVYNNVTEVNVLDSKDAANLALLARPDLGITFTKLHCWRLTQYDKCCFLDADTLVIENCDELSEREELSAAPDVGWPDCFNSGVFVYKPSIDTFQSLMSFALQFGSFDGGDQGLLNLYFKDWAHKDISRHLPFIYNMASTATYSYLPAFKQFGSQAKIIHFIGTSKPWLCYLDSESKTVQAPGEFRHLQGLLQYWWDVFCQNVHPSLTPAMHVDRSFFQSPHTHPAHHDMGPALPVSHTYHEPAPLFTDPWDIYLERMQQEVQSQKQKENWLEVLEKDQRQKGCQDDNPSSESDSYGNSYNEAKHHEQEAHDWHSSAHDHSQNYEQSQSHPISPPSPPPSQPANNESGWDRTDGHSDHNESAGLAGALSQLTLGTPRSAEQCALEDQYRRQAWEQGHIDYMGRDSFENIWSKVMETVTGSPAASASVSDSAPASASPTAAPAAAPASAAAPAPAAAAAPAPAPTPTPAPQSPCAPAPAAVPAPATPAPSAAPVPEVVSPGTPTVTMATPPTSPPISSPPQPQPSPEALKVDPTPPGTPPVGAQPQTSEPLDPNAPVPPKRKGSGSGKGKK